jgi:hypothetical protein
MSSKGDAGMSWAKPLQGTSQTEAALSAAGFWSYRWVMRGGDGKGRMVVRGRKRPDHEEGEEHLRYSDAFHWH